MVERRIVNTGRNWIIDRLNELDTRLKRVRSPSSGIPMVATAAIASSALNALEAGITRSSQELRSAAARLRRRAAAIEEDDRRRLRHANKALTLLQLRADRLFSTYDLLQDATAIRADAVMGQMLSGVDMIIRQSLRRPVPGYRPPQALCYLDSAGRGGAIARARTRLPGGFVLPLALVRVSPESLPMRLSSVLHECGHQLSVDLNLLDEARRKIIEFVTGVTGKKSLATTYAGWTGELMADLWGIVLGGGAPAVDGLQRVLSLPEQLLYMIRRSAPHPPGPVRVAFADAAARQLYNDPLLDQLRKRFHAIYGTPKISLNNRNQFRALLAVTPATAKMLMTEPFDGLGGRTLVDCGEGDAIHPRRLRQSVGNMAQNNGRSLDSLTPLQGLAALSITRLDNTMGIDQLHDITSAWLARLAVRHFRGRQSAPAKTTTHSLQTTRAYS